MSVMLYPCIFCVTLSMDLFVFVLRVFEWFGDTIRNMFGCVCYFLVQCDGVVMFCLWFCMSEVISLFRSLRTGLHVFALLMLFLYVICHTMSSGKSL